jgi:glycosyltransferase involved in cell wall biosynthesis
MRVLLPWYKFPPFSRNSIGGLSVAVWELAEKLAQHGVAVELLVPPARDEPHSETIDGLHVTRSELGKTFVLNQRAQREDLNYFENFDSIISISNFASRTLEPLKNHRLIRFIHSCASDRPVSSYVSLGFNLLEYPRMFVQRRNEIAAEKRLSGTKTVCVSKYLSSVMELHRVESHTNLVFVPNGIDTEVFRPKDRELLHDLLFVGRFQNMKGLDVLIAAMNALGGRGKKLTLGIVGRFDESQRKYCLGLASRDVKDKITFLGLVNHDDMPGFYNSCRAVVCPSRYEGFCLPALESLACGRTVIASDVGGIPELVDSQVGKLVRSGNANLLARTISDVFEYPKFLEETRTKGPEKVTPYYWKVVIESLMGILGNASNSNR